MSERLLAGPCATAHELQQGAVHVMRRLGRGAHDSLRWRAAGGARAPQGARSPNAADRRRLSGDPRLRPARYSHGMASARRQRARHGRGNIS